ncbi:MAG: hypothetical protein QOD30_1583 [Actinomycetota bacterium]|jgi:uncharacterized membrane protein|nr:hypothetical protein [Actinomycetota bacterium]
MTATETEIVVPPEAQPYLAAVRSLLASLPDEQRDELLDDVAAHLTELSAEGDGTLADRLGPPSRYAADFVSSAGLQLPDPEPATTRLRDAIHVPDALRARFDAMRPAWVVLRPFLVALAAAQLFPGNAFALVSFLVLAAASVRRSQQLAGSGWDAMASLIAVVALLVIVGQWTGARTVYVHDVGPAPMDGPLSKGDGNPITNIWAYDANGRPVRVFLYDQLGRAIETPIVESYDDRTGERIVGDLPTDANGAPVPNLYPRPQRRIGDAGGSRDEPPPAITTPRLGDDTTSSTTSTSTTTSTTTTTPPPTP